MVVDGGKIGSGMEESLVLAIWIMWKLEKRSFEKCDLIGCGSDTM